MTGPSALPTLTVPGPSVVETQWRRTFREMASPVTVTLGPGCIYPERVFAKVVEIFGEVSAQCTRFDANSDLMRANRSADVPARVGTYCLRSLGVAAAAHQDTGGRFDPRVLGRLVALGYARSVESGRDGGPVDIRPVPRTPWQPSIDPTRQTVRVGPVPVDLGGIAKGLAVLWAAQAIADTCPSFIVEAGGDLLVHGPSPEGSSWRIAVEDPRGRSDPIAVLELQEGACATSSVRRARWTHHNREVHHLIDPATGEPGGAGLLSVTVVDCDSADAEVWSKVFFLCGADAIAAEVERRDSAALWVCTDGSMHMSAAMQSLVIWPEAR